MEPRSVYWKDSLTCFNCLGKRPSFDLLKLKVVIITGLAVFLDW